MSQPTNNSKQLGKKLWDAERKNGGEYYTLKSSVNLTVEMLEACKGRAYDPAIDVHLKNRNAEPLRPQSAYPRNSSALSAAPRFKT